jgi:hypothetical protein
MQTREQRTILASVNGRAVSLLACKHLSIQAENLFLRRQLALYIKRGVKPRRIDAATRIALTLVSHLFD